MLFRSELYNGELSDLRNAMLPMLAAAGGIAAPALIHFGFNGGTITQAGVGIPMATDIAFAASTVLEGDRIALYYSLEDRMLRRALIGVYSR